MSQPHSTLRHNVFNAQLFDLGQYTCCDRAGEDRSGRVFQAACWPSLDEVRLGSFSAEPADYARHPMSALPRSRQICMAAQYVATGHIRTHALQRIFGLLDHHIGAT
jgi:hypothetical protein